jgi:hypothetical protein
VLDLLGGQSKCGQQFNDDLNNHLSHDRRTRDFGIDPKALDEVTDGLEDVEECIIARIDVLHSLRHGMSQEHALRVRKTLTVRRMPIAANISFTGGKDY